MFISVAMQTDEKRGLWTALIMLPATRLPDSHRRANKAGEYINPV